MKIDKYRSKVKPSFCLVVPTGADLAAFTGEVADGIKVLQPLVKIKTNVALESFCRGDLFDHHQQQLAELGASVEETKVFFSELSNG